jgi:predicted amidohydrolase
MEIIGCQLDIRWEDKDANHAKVKKLLQEASFLPDSLIVLPEMFATGFSMNVRAIAENQQRASQDFLASLAVELKGFATASFIRFPMQVKRFITRQDQRSKPLPATDLSWRPSSVTTSASQRPFE